MDQTLKYSVLIKNESKQNDYNVGKYTKSEYKSPTSPNVKYWLER